MPPRKTVKMQESATSRSNHAERKRLEITPHDPSKSLQVLSYPHLLALILQHSPPSSLVTLLRCSREMSRVAAPLLYRDLRVTPLQLKAMVDAGWSQTSSRSKRGPSFSPFLFQALQQVRTLHLADYQPDFDYPKLPRGCFSGCTRVVLYVEPEYCENVYTFHPIFQSLGPDLYICLSERFIQDHGDVYRDAFLRTVPRSIKTVTLLFPLAYKLPCAPSLGYHSLSQTLTTTVVLLPWTFISTEDHPDWELQCSMSERWTSYDRGHTYPHRHLDHFVSADLAGGHSADDFSPLLGRNQTTDSIPHVPAFIPFDHWLNEREIDGILPYPKRWMVKGFEVELGMATLSLAKYEVDLESMRLDVEATGSVEMAQQFQKLLEGRADRQAFLAGWAARIERIRRMVEDKYR